MTYTLSGACDMIGKLWPPISTELLVISSSKRSGSAGAVNQCASVVDPSNLQTGAGGAGGAGTGAGAGDGAGAGSDDGGGTGVGVGAGVVTSGCPATVAVGDVGVLPQATTEAVSATAINILRHNNLRTLHLARMMVHCACRQWLSRGSRAYAASCLLSYYLMRWKPKKRSASVRVFVTVLTST